MSVRISIIIKALNEERNIAHTLESALAVVDAVGGSAEVILADSLSTDRTVEIAKTYPIRIVQLLDTADRCCGVGAEIGYRIARGEYLYILDADMALDPEFVVAAVAALDADSTIAGVGGLIEEMNIVNAEFRGRVGKSTAHLQPGEVDRLNGGGLFRKSAVDKLGYLTNRNLHAFEEYELAVRLRANGWRLVRLNQVAVKHYGHTDASFALLWRRWRARYAWGAGELLREAWGSHYFGTVLRSIQLYRQGAMVAAWWMAALISGGLALLYPGVWWLVGALLTTPFVAAAVRRKSIADGVYVVAFQNLYTAGIIAGFFAAKRGDPRVAPVLRELK